MSQLLWAGPHPSVDQRAADTPLRVSGSVHWSFLSANLRNLATVVAAADNCGDEDPPHCELVCWEIDIVSAPEFEEKLSTVGSIIVVDLRHLDFMDSSGLAVLLRRQQKLEEGSELRLVVKPGIIDRLFEVSGLDKVFSIYSDIDAAIDGAGSVSASS